jgi:hypothetical protein
MPTTPRPVRLQAFCKQVVAVSDSHILRHANRLGEPFGKPANYSELARPFHADPLGSVPTAYFPAGRLGDSLDPRVNDPSACGCVRLPDDFPLAGLVGEAIANPKLHRKDLGVARCLRLVFLRGARSRHARSDIVGSIQSHNRDNPKSPNPS